VPGSYAIEVQRLATAHKFSPPAHRGHRGRNWHAAHVTAARISISRSAHEQHAGRHRGRDQQLGGGQKVVATVITNTDARLTITKTWRGRRHDHHAGGGDGGLAGLVYPHAGTGLTRLQEAPMRAC
jgi:hypothetical protein